MKKILTLILCLMFLGVNATFAAESNSTENAVQNKTAAEKQKVKRCPCKKIFEKTLGLTQEQIKLADKNRADEKKEIKAVNKKIKKLKSKKQSEKNMKKIADLKQKKLDIKAKHNEIFESYLTDEQKAKLQQMREDKKNGKSCCPCGRNPYY